MGLAILAAGREQGEHAPPSIRDQLIGYLCIRAYNDMLYLCEKYAPLDTLERYDPQKDISVTGILERYDVMAGVKAV